MQMVVNFGVSITLRLRASRRAGFRRAWCVPYKCRTFVLQIISNRIQLYDTIQRVSKMSLI